MNYLLAGEKMSWNNVLFSLFTPTDCFNSLHTAQSSTPEHTYIQNVSQIITKVMYSNFKSYSVLDNIQHVIKYPSDSVMVRVYKPMGGFLTHCKLPGTVL